MRCKCGEELEMCSFTGYTPRTCERCDALGKITGPGQPDRPRVKVINESIDI